MSRATKVMVGAVLATLSSLALITPVSAATATSSAAPNLAATASITRTQIHNRALYWVNLHVPYNQDASHKANSSPTGPYRTDCSGFVSMAWGLSSSLTTQTLVGVSNKISKSQLKTGDVLDYNSSTDPVNGSHVVLFVRWANKAHTSYVLDEEAGGGLGAVQRTVRYPYDVQLQGGSWIPYRYKHVS